MSADAIAIEKRLQALKGERAKHESRWRECFALTFPERAEGIQGAKGESGDQDRIYDSTAADSCQVGAASIVGGMTPSNAQWLALESNDEAEREWLSTAAKFIWENIHASNFDAESMDAVTDSFVTGWFVLYAEESPDGGGFRFEEWPVGQCYIASSRNGGTVDTIYREWTYTVGQCVAIYGIDNVSEQTRAAYLANRVDEQVLMLHAIEPRADHKAGSPLAKQMPFLSAHMEVTNKHVVLESGYPEFPCAVPRWHRKPASVYADGPMSRALPDARTLQQAVMLTMLGGEATLAPTMVAVDDGVLNARNIKMGPRKVIIANSVDSIKPLVTGARVDMGFLMVEKIQASIKRILMADQLPPADGPVKTAYEWSVRVDTIRKILGPMFGRFQSEWLAVMVERLFAITWRANIRSGFRLLGPPPATLTNSYTVRYMSALARAQRMEEVGALDRFEQSLEQQAQSVPSVRDVWDSDGAARERAHLLGVSPKLVRDPKDTERVRAARARAQQQEQQQAIAAQGQAGMQDAMAQRVANAA